MREGGERKKKATAQRKGKTHKRTNPKSKTNLATEVIHVVGNLTEERVVEVEPHSCDAQGSKYWDRQENPLKGIEKPGKRKYHKRSKRLKRNLTPAPLNHTSNPNSNLTQTYVTQTHKPEPKLAYLTFNVAIYF